mgnify:CR=1 FL=1
MKQTPLLVLLIEDDMDLAATVADYLALKGIECDHAYNGRAGLDAAMAGGFDLILLDINLPRIDGLNVCDSLRRANVTAPVLMMTARDTVDDKVAGFTVGADDYLVKPFAFEELEVRIRALIRRSQSQASMLEIGDLEINITSRTAQRAGRALNLSPTGWVLLEHLARNSPKVISREQLERLIWDGEAPESDSLKVHLYKLRRQVQRPFETPLLHTVRGVGTALRP